MLCCGKHSCCTFLPHSKARTEPGQQLQLPWPLGKGVERLALDSVPIALTLLQTQPGGRVTSLPSSALPVAKITNWASKNVCTHF